MTDPFALAHLCLRHKCRQDKPQVECYSGHTYAQEPRAVVWQGRRCQVEAVVARWRTPDGPAFRVRTQFAQLFDLRYHELEGRWSVVQAEPASGSDTPGDP